MTVYERANVSYRFMHSYIYAKLNSYMVAFVQSYIHAKLRCHGSPYACSLTLTINMPSLTISHHHSVWHAFHQKIAFAVLIILRL